MFLKCPLDQFEIRNLTILDAPILGNSSLSLTNISLYLTLGGYLVFAIVSLIVSWDILSIISQEPIILKDYKINGKSYETINLIYVPIPEDTDMFRRCGHAEWFRRERIAIYHGNQTYNGPGLVCGPLNLGYIRIDGHLTWWKIYYYTRLWELNGGDRYTVHIMSKSSWGM